MLVLLVHYYFSERLSVMRSPVAVVEHLVSKVCFDHDHFAHVHLKENVRVHFVHTPFWWLVELPYWFKVTFCPKV